MMERSAAPHREAVLLLGVDAAARSLLDGMIQETGYAERTVSSLEELHTRLKSNPAAALIVDIDAVPLDNRAIRGLAAAAPGMPILCLSSARFHPELKESFLSHIYACITKPIDFEELRYWLRSIQEDERNRAAAEKKPPAEDIPLETEEKWKNPNP